MRRALAALVVAATGAIAVAGWGCASQPVAVREHDWQHYEPDGGWQAQRPPSQEYDPSAAKSALAQPSLQPAGLGTTSPH